MASSSSFVSAARDVEGPESAPVSSWCLSPNKRIFDFVSALCLTILVLPLMLFIAALVKVTSDGPVLFHQKRCGKDGKQFDLLKFRSMTHRRPEAGPSLTRIGDRRVTRNGKLLRRWKLDELPQLFNVLAGHMSLVGPRPDMPEFIGTLAPAEMQILKVRPGITGWATLCFRHEEELLAGVPSDQLEKCYISEVLPKKVQLDLAYAKRSTFKTDLRVLLRTCREILR